MRGILFVLLCMLSLAYWGAEPTEAASGSDSGGSEVEVTAADIDHADAPPPDGAVPPPRPDGMPPAPKWPQDKRGERGERGGAPHPGGMIPHNVRSYFERLAQENPQEFQRLMQLRRSDPESFVSEVKKAIPPPDREEQHRNFQVERECFRLAEELRKATDDAEKERLSKELDERTRESFDAVLQRAEAQLEEMRRYIERLRNDRERLLKARREFYLNAKKPPMPPPMPPEQPEQPIRPDTAEGPEK